MKKNRIPIRIVSSIMLASFLSTLIINPTITFSSSNSSSTVTPLYFGVMLHAEGYENEASNKTVFEKHANMIRTYASIFEANGARLTVEARPEFVQGCIRWEDNVLKELENKGHGIGVHADAGNQPGLTMKQFTQQLKDMKADIESLGVTVRHVSGVNSPLDWVKAASDAGFIAVSGVVAYSVKSLPRENVPPEYLYAYDSTNPGQAHESIPFEADEQLHPWRMESGLNWLNRSATGPAVILTGDSGKGINTLAGDDKLIDQEDIDAFIELLDEHLKYVRPGLVNEYYVAWSVGTEQDPAMVDAWLKAIKPYVDSGKVVFKTLPEMLDAYLQWEKKDYFAEGTCRPNFEPYICIQNPDTRDANVKITYMLGDGTTKEQTLTVGKQSRYTVAVKDFLGEGDDASHDFSAKVDCTNVVKIICERPVYFNYQQEIDGGHNVMGFTVR